MPLSERYRDLVKHQTTPHAIQFLSRVIHRSSAVENGSFRDSEEAPNLSVDIHGVIACPHHPLEAKDNLNFCTFVCYPMTHLLPIPKVFITHLTDARIDTATGEIEEIVKGESPWRDDEIVDSFDPSRLPPRIVIKLLGARKAAEKEINDLLAPTGRNHLPW